MLDLSNRVLSLPANRDLSQLQEDGTTARKRSNSADHTHPVLVLGELGLYLRRILVDRQFGLQLAESGTVVLSGHLQQHTVSDVMH